MANRFDRSGVQIPEELKTLLKKYIERKVEWMHSIRREGSREQDTFLSIEYDDVQDKVFLNDVRGNRVDMQFCPEAIGPASEWLERIEANRQQRFADYMGILEHTDGIRKSVIPICLSQDETDYVSVKGDDVRFYEEFSDEEWKSLDSPAMRELHSDVLHEIAAVLHEHNQLKDDLRYLGEEGVAVRGYGKVLVADDGTVQVNGLQFTEMLPENRRLLASSVRQMYRNRREAAGIEVAVTPDRYPQEILTDTYAANMFAEEMGKDYSEQLRDLYVRQGTQVPESHIQDVSRAYRKAYLQAVEDLCYFDKEIHAVQATRQSMNVAHVDDAMYFVEQNREWEVKHGPFTTHHFAYLDDVDGERFRLVCGNYRVDERRPLTDPQRVSPASGHFIEFGVDGKAVSKGYINNDQLLAEAQNMKIKI